MSTPENYEYPLKSTGSGDTLFSVPLVEITADSVTTKITDNLVASLEAQVFTIGTKSYNSKAEQQRSQYDSNGQAFYIEICGPWPETLEETTMIKHVNLHYVIEAHLNDINDKAPNDPITKQTRNIVAELTKIIMSDLTRGGNALDTKIEGEPYYYFSGSVNAPEFILRADVTVKAWLDAQNPYSIGR